MKVLTNITLGIGEYFDACVNASDTKTKLNLVFNGTDSFGNKVSLKYDSDHDIKQDNNIVSNVDAFYTGHKRLLTTKDIIRHKFYLGWTNPIA